MRTWMGVWKTSTHALIAQLWAGCVIAALAGRALAGRIPLSIVFFFWWAPSSWLLSHYRGGTLGNPVSQRKHHSNNWAAQLPSWTLIIHGPAPALRHILDVVPALENTMYLLRLGDSSDLFGGARRDLGKVSDMLLDGGKKVSPSPAPTAKIRKAMPSYAKLGFFTSVHGSLWIKLRNRIKKWLITECFLYESWCERASLFFTT